MTFLRWLGPVLTMVLLAVFLVVGGIALTEDRGAPACLEVKQAIKESQQAAKLCIDLGDCVVTLADVRHHVTLLHRQEAVCRP